MLSDETRPVWKEGRPNSSWKYSIST